MRILVRNTVLGDCVVSTALLKRKNWGALSSPQAQARKGFTESIRRLGHVPWSWGLHCCVPGTGMSLGRQLCRWSGPGHSLKLAGSTRVGGNERHMSVS